MHQYLVEAMWPNGYDARFEFDGIIVPELIPGRHEILLDYLMFQYVASVTSAFKAETLLNTLKYGPG